jgi:hypothetical protein
VTRSSIKVWLFGALFFAVNSAQAFNVLQCQGNIDVRLKGPSKKTERVAQKFTIKREDALELDLSVDGVSLGHLFPWDHVVWEADIALTKNFKDVKFKTDDSKLILISAVALKTKAARKIECEFNFD